MTKRKIYDCSTFFKGNLLFETRLKTLENFVDHFVVQKRFGFEGTQLEPFRGLSARRPAQFKPQRQAGLHRQKTERCAGQGTVEDRADRPDRLCERVHPRLGQSLTVPRTIARWPVCQSFSLNSIQCSALSP